MKTIVSLASALSIVLLAAQPGLADCADMTQSTSPSEKGIAKDGTHAPLEQGNVAQEQPGPAEGSTTASSDTKAASPQKGSGDMPMGESESLATSGQDAEAQQQGEKTASATAQKC